jgi:hypothetical protein
MLRTHNYPPIIIYVSVCLFVCLSIDPSIDLSIDRNNLIYLILSKHPSIHPSIQIHPCFNTPTHIKKIWPSHQIAKHIPKFMEKVHGTQKPILSASSPHVPRLLLAVESSCRLAVTSCRWTPGAQVQQNARSSMVSMGKYQGLKTIDNIR